MDEIIKSFIKIFKCNMNYTPISLGLGNAHVFFINTNNLLLNDVWKEMRNFIAIKFQNNLAIEFERWNVYVFYIVEFPLDDALKYKIENDTFSSRKIVIEGNYDFEKIIKEHILNNDIVINSISISKKKFKPNSLIYNQLEELKVKTKVTDKMKDAYAQIVDRIKENANEI